MPKVIFYIGIPCSGKSTAAYWEKLDMAAYQLPTVILSRDTIRVEIHGKYLWKPTYERAVTSIFNRRLGEALADVNHIIIDNTNTNPKYIREIIGKLPSWYKWELRWFDVSLLTAHYRNIMRYMFGEEKKWIPFKVINKFYKEYKKFKKDYESGKITF